ncbi:MAG: alpha/beta fold hydrolase [Bacillota bacterium]
MSKLPIKESFFLPGNEIGCLMVHGFGSTPGEVAGLGQLLHQQGYTIKGTLLAGHGTSPGKMAKTSWRDWYHSLEEDIVFLRTSCSEVWVFGLSLGGALGLYAASQGLLDGLVAMAAPTGLVDRKARYAKYARFFMPYTKLKLTTSQQEFNRRSGRYVYPKWPLKAIGSLYDFIQISNQSLHKIIIPTLIIHTRIDEVILPGSGQEIYQKINSPIKELVLLENSGHIVTESLEKDVVNEKAVGFIKRIVENRK